jgi:hypothetical protein
LRYKLDMAGIDARNELLILLDLEPEGRIVEAVAKIVGLYGKTTVKWLIKEPLGSVQMEGMEKFFAGLLTAVRIKYNGRCDENCQVRDPRLHSTLSRDILITEAGLRSYFYHDYHNNHQDKKNWIVPGHFWIQDNTVRPHKNVQRQTQSTVNLQNRNSINPAKEIADLLWSLDYQDQQKYFVDRIDEYFSHAIAFSVAAPRPKSEIEGSLQEWILCRLGRAMDSSVSGWQSRAQQILLEPPECKSGSGSTGWGLVEMCQTIETVLLANGVPFSSSKPDDIIDALAKYSATTPVLIQVRNLHYEQSSREILINIFWKTLIKQASKIALSRSTKRSRLIMIVLEDSNFPEQDETSFFYPLRQLDINFADVDKWAFPERVKLALAKCDEWNDDIDRQIDDLIENQIRGWPCWAEPSIAIKLPEIFDGLCRLLNSGYGSKRVSEYWKI